MPKRRALRFVRVGADCSSMVPIASAHNPRPTRIPPTRQTSRVVRRIRLAGGGRRVWGGREDYGLLPIGIRPASAADSIRRATRVITQSHRRQGTGADSRRLLLALHRGAPVIGPSTGSPFAPRARTPHSPCGRLRGAWLGRPERVLRAPVGQAEAEQKPAAHPARRDHAAPLKDVIEELDPAGVHQFCSRTLTMTSSST